MQNKLARFTLIFLLLAILPILFWLLALLLNGIFGCGIENEASTIGNGSCGTGLSDLIYTMMMSMWFLMITLPVFGLLTCISGLVALVQWWKNHHR